MKDKIVFACRVRAVRLENNLCQADFAEKIKTSQAVVCAWERGESYPRMDSILRVCRMFGCSSDWLLGLKDSEV